MSPLNSPGSQPPASNQEQPPAYPSQVGVNIFYRWHHATLIQKSSWISDLHIRHVVVLHSSRIFLLHTSHNTPITLHCILLRKKDTNILIVWSCPSSSLTQHFAGAIYPVNVTWFQIESPAELEFRETKVELKTSVKTTLAQPKLWCV